MEARPLSGFYHMDDDFWLQKCISTQEAKQSPNFQSDSGSNCFTIDVWKLIHQFIFLLLIIILSHFAQVL